MNQYRLLTTLATVLIGSALIGTPAEASVYPTSRTCTAGESWFIDAPISQDYQTEFKDFLRDPRSDRAVRGLSEAIALRKVAKTQTEKWFAEYWISRAFYNMGLPHVAYLGFLAMTRKTPDAELMPIHAAALDCLLRLHQQHSSMEFALPALASLKLELDPGIPEEIKKHSEEVAWDSITAGIQVLIADDRTDPKQIQSLLTLLNGSGAYESFSQGIWAAKQNIHVKTIEHFKNFFTQKTPESLIRHGDTAHLLLARAYYSTEEFELANLEMKAVSRRSNELADSLSELAWADLMAERYSESIGTAMNLEAGGLRHTYEPEAPMVAAMAMNELCQYPDAVNEIQIFKKDYGKLANWVATQADHPETLYQQAVQFVRRKNELPERVAGEWVRTPLFIASQDEINLLFDERDFLPKVGATAGRVQRTMALEILKHARELKPKLKIAKMKLKQGEELPGSIQDSLALLRQQVIHWKRIQLAAPIWVAVSKRFHGTIAPTQSRLIARVNADIKARNLKMLTQLDEIAENIQLIEVEIYNGASQDIIWQNAHPDYKAIAKAMREEHDQVMRSKVWDWGRSLAGAQDGSEIWEDELGSFQANLYDNCSSKDKYLAISKKNRRSS
jgi:hypothetical protein